MDDAPKSQDDHSTAALRGEPEAVWRDLYRRAINEANGLTNYVEDRPELRSAEKRIAKIEEAARVALAQPPQAASGFSHTARSDDQSKVDDQEPTAGSSHG